MDTKPHNAYYDRPAILSLLPPVTGLRVLDTGCGPGAYAEWLAEQRAHVTAVDVSPTMVELARERVGGVATVLEVDLETPLPFDEGAFDLVLSALVLDSIERWEPVFAELFRVLAPGGALVLSAGHPQDEWRRSAADGGRYFDVEARSHRFRWPEHDVDLPVPYWRRPLQAMIQPAIVAGFLLERVLEPLPAPEYAEADPEEYETLLKAPDFICFRWRKG